MPEHDAALDSFKKAFTEALVFRFFDPDQQIVLQADAQKMASVHVYCNRNAQSHIPQDH